MLRPTARRLNRRPILPAAAFVLLASASAAAAQQPSPETRSSERIGPPDRAVELAQATPRPEERARLVTERRATAEARAKEKGLRLPEARPPAASAAAPRAQ